MQLNCAFVFAYAKSRFSHDAAYIGIVLVVNFFRFFLIIIFCFVVAKFDLLHDVEAIRGLCKLQTASGNLF